MSRRALRAILLVGLLALVLPAVAAAVQPIEGTWEFQHGRILVEATGPGTFKGIVTSPTRFLDCDHPLGERMWSLTGSGDSYTGTHEWFQDPGCTLAPGGLATWTVHDSGAQFTLDFCTAPPNQGQPTLANPATRCSTLQRAKPPPPRPPQVCLGATCLVAPGDARKIGCVRRGRFKHHFEVRLRRRSGVREQVKIVRFTLDRKANGSDRRSPYVAIVDGRRLKPGNHVLAANVTLVSRKLRGSRRARRPRTTVLHLKYAFRACE